MNSHKLNMYAGAIIGSLLFFLLLGFFSELIFIGGEEEHEQLAFAIEVEEAEEAPAEEQATDWGALLAAVDLANGEKAFGKCKACHQLTEGANGVGPSLWGVVGREIASAAGFNFSPALAEIDGSWDIAQLSDFLAAPKSYAPGTKMSFAGVKKIQDRVDLIAYLNELDGTPVDLAPEGDASEAAPETSTAEAATEAVTETATAAVEAVTETTAAAVEAAAETATEAAAAATEAATETVTAIGEAVSETAAAATEAVAGAGGDDFASLLAAADAAAGEKIYRKCRGCHKLEQGKNAVGPTLWGIVGSDIGSVEGYKYSDAALAAEGNWTGTNLFEFLANPKEFLPGTKMSFRGLKKPEDRINVIAYLNEVDGTPEPLQ